MSETPNELGQITERPWGSYEVLLDAANCKVKRIIVKAGKRLSLQSHKLRAEHWTIVEGSAILTLGDEQSVHEEMVHPGEHVYIAREELHRIEARQQDVTFIEVQLGDYFGEDDITRYEDDFGRK